MKFTLLGSLLVCCLWMTGCCHCHSACNSPCDGFQWEPWGYNDCVDCGSGCGSCGGCGGQGMSGGNSLPGNPAGCGCNSGQQMMPYAVAEPMSTYAEPYQQGAQYSQQPGQVVPHPAAQPNPVQMVPPAPAVENKMPPPGEAATQRQQYHPSQYFPPVGAAPMIQQTGYNSNMPRGVRR